MKYAVCLFFASLLFFSCKKEKQPSQAAASTQNPGTATVTPVDYYISGTVRQYDMYDEAITSSPASIMVSLEGTSYSTHCNSNGYFLLDGLPANTYTVAITKPGFGVSRRQIYVGPFVHTPGTPGHGGNWNNGEFRISQTPTWSLTIGSSSPVTQVFYTNGGVGTNGQVEQGFSFPVTTSQLAVGHYMDIGIYFSKVNQINPLDTATYEYYDYVRCPGIYGATNVAIAYNRLPFPQSGDTIFYQVYPTTLYSQIYYGTGGIYNSQVYTAINTNNLQNGYMVIP
jgi:hypothetical protein